MVRLQLWAVNAWSTAADGAPSTARPASVAAATSAVRESPNAAEFVQRVEDEIGLTIDIIAGEEEARRIYLGVLSGMEFEGAPHMIVDIGGGSTELIFLCVLES